LWHYQDFFATFAVAFDSDVKMGGTLVLQI
jgi:hypothetical protein